MVSLRKNPSNNLHFRFRAGRTAYASFKKWFVENLLEHGRISCDTTDPQADALVGSIFFNNGEDSAAAFFKMRWSNSFGDTL
jgi:hypothetical protein